LPHDPLAAPAARPYTPVPVPRGRVAGALAVAVGGLLLIASPFVDWLGVRMAGLSRSFTLSGSLRSLGRESLLGPGMSVGPLIAAGALALALGGTTVVLRSRLPAVLAIMVGAAAGAFTAYLHAALEYTGFVIAGFGSIRVQTTPGPGLFLAIAGSAAVLGGGIWSLAGPGGQE